MVATWYRARTWFGGEIEEVEVEGESAQFVMIGGRRRLKVSDREAVCPTFNDAKQWLVDGCEREIASYAGALERAKARLKHVKALAPQ